MLRVLKMPAVISNKFNQPVWNENFAMDSYYLDSIV